MSIIPSLFGGRSSGAFDPLNPFSIEVWDPFPAFPDLAAGGRSGQFVKEASAVANTQIDWKETPKAHIFKADLPGLKKEEVKIALQEDERILQISGKRSKEEEQKNDKWHRIERSRGKFLRRFRLPENVKVEEIKAAMENGVLTLTVPKQPAAQAPQPKSRLIFKAHIFRADLPGLKKEEVKIELQEDQGIVQISGERSKEEEQKNDKWHSIKRSHEKFLRSFRLPENVKVEEMKAAMENGVLTVTVPKQPAAKNPQPKSIKISVPKQPAAKNHSTKAACSQESPTQIHQNLWLTFHLI